jgi:HAD superfamily hydrolase (TIGR01484 family)
VKPIHELPLAVRQEIQAVFTDIDDTITTDGRVPAVAFSALWRAYDAGLAVVLVTGRPAGWCDHFARMWPVAAVVGENGALCFASRAGRIERLYAERQEQAAERLRAIEHEVRERVPRARVASDQAYREYDLAIDFCEEVDPPLDDEQVDEIVAIYERHGATVKVSSIHVNGWFGDFDKLTMCRRASEAFLGAPLDPSRAVYVGDSPNDVPMFAAFPHGCGVANVRRMAARMETLPAYITEQEGGAGFAEVIATILDR